MVLHFEAFMIIFTFNVSVSLPTNSESTCSNSILISMFWLDSNCFSCYFKFRCWNKKIIPVISWGTLHFGRIWLSSVWLKWPSCNRVGKIFRIFWLYRVYYPLAPEKSPYFAKSMVNQPPKPNNQQANSDSVHWLTMVYVLKRASLTCSGHR